MALSGPLPPIFELVAYFAFLGVLAIALVLLRELYPDWPPGFFRAAYDWILMAVILFFAIQVIYYLATVAAS